MKRTTTYFFALALLAACDSTPADPGIPAGPIQFTVVSGDEQVGAAGEELPNPLVVRALDARGHPVRRQVVSFVVTAGGGSVWAGAALTDPQGYARERWRLGPEPEENRLEARMVDQETGEGLLLHTFTASAVEAAPETCNGTDDDLDGVIDEDMAYCAGGLPAPNTDGAACLDGWADLDGVPDNGCEAATDVSGDYLLEPHVQLSCPLPLLFADWLVVREVQILDGGFDVLRFDILIEYGASVLVAKNLVSYDRDAGTFSGSGDLSAAEEISGTTLEVDGTFEITGAFTGPDVFEANASVSLRLTATLSGVTSSISCGLSAMDVVGTR